MRKYMKSWSWTILGMVVIFVFANIYWQNPKLGFLLMANDKNQSSIAMNYVITTFSSSSNKTIFLSSDEEKYATCHARIHQFYHDNPNPSPICLVHLGKTAGSTITCLMNQTVQSSGKGNSQCSSSRHPKAEVSAIANHVTQRVHLVPAPVSEYDVFLITLRNPIERFLSWYFYLHPDYPPNKLPRHGRQCDHFSVFHCWNTLQSFANQGLQRQIPNFNNSSNNNKNDNDNNNNNNNMTLQNKRQFCKALAWDITTGTRHCWHNYWNYNRTYGPLLDGTKTTMGGNHHSKQIFAIRTEHVWDDWKTIDIMLGGTGRLDTIPETKNQYRNESIPNRTLDPIGQDQLCHALCEEIQIYKQLLMVAMNLCPSDREQSLKELLHSCPQEETKYVRDCKRTLIRW